ncbi:MAG: YggS family pyridoxal phosphate-dependent enzyme [Flavobacteriaceae bacterium]|nr:YggS family pyridoxal phosphate-dependent enzyme [Flavobacteriaceae bacterium]
MFVGERIKSLLNTLPKEVTLVAVSKTKPIADIREAYEAGQHDFGENKIQEMCQKAAELPKDIRWHMIGHVQTNKIKYMASFVHLIHGVDSWKTLVEIDRQAKKHNRVIDCLLQANISKEDTKFGMQFDEIEKILLGPEIDNLHHIKIKGLMGMASFVEDESVLDEEFASLKGFYDQLLKKEIATKNIHLEILSMGMSGDYLIAIRNGSNMVRIGSSIFGERNYLAE